MRGKATEKAAQREPAGAPRELPILFTGPMVKAILAGKKTQTRRVVKRPARVCDHCWRESVEHNGREAAMGGPCYLRVPFCCHGDVSVGRVRPRWMPGDRLWVRETWCEDYDGARTHYRADGGESPGPRGFWRSPIHLPRARSRLLLRVLEVRVERVQAITPKEAKAEGVGLYASPNRETPNWYVSSFRNLWDTINAERGFCWESNPWVWVVRFRRVAS